MQTRTMRMHYYQVVTKILLLGGILLFNMSLFMWLANHFWWKDDGLPETLISNAKAEATRSGGNRTPSLNPKPANMNPTSVARAKARLLNSSPGGSGKGQVVLRFDESTIHLSPAERSRLMAVLEHLNIGANHRIRVLTGPVPTESNILTAQTEKLRAQNVVRVIFPYTRHVRVKLHQPSVESGAVAIEFLPMDSGKKGVRG